MPEIDKDLAEEIKSRLAAVMDDGRDEEAWHEKADDLLCEMLNRLGYGEVVKAFERIPKWYS